MFLFEDGKIKVKPYKRIYKAAFRKCYANQKKKKLLIRKYTKTTQIYLPSTGN